MLLQSIKTIKDALSIYEMTDVLIIRNRLVRQKSQDKGNVVNLGYESDFGIDL